MWEVLGQLRGDRRCRSSIKLPKGCFVTDLSTKLRTISAFGTLNVVLDRTDLTMLPTISCNWLRRASCVSSRTRSWPARTPSKRACSTILNIYGFTLRCIWNSSPVTRLRKSLRWFLPLQSWSSCGFRPCGTRRSGSRRISSWRRVHLEPRWPRNGCQLTVVRRQTLTYEVLFVINCFQFRNCTAFVRILNCGRGQISILEGTGGIEVNSSSFSPQHSLIRKRLALSHRPMYDPYGVTQRSCQVGPHCAGWASFFVIQLHFGR